jgi:hypothetical protein
MKIKLESSGQCRNWALRLAALGLALVPLYSPLPASTQDCQASGDLDDATRAAITTAGQRYFDLAAKGDTASMRQSAIPSLASNFSGVETSVKDYQQEFASAQATVKSTFLLEAEGSAPLPHAEFYCGVFGKSGQTAGSAVFSIPDLPPGKYAIVLFDVASSKARASFSLILQQQGSDWKLGGLYIKPAQVAGHDSEWFAARAREYKAKGQLHNAWFFFLEARSLISPVPFMSTQATDKLYDESQSVQPADLPANGKTVDLAAAGVTYKLTALLPEAVGNDLDLVVRYQTADATNSNLAYQTNVAVIKALVAKYPEIRETFAAVVSRAVDSNGRDYGTLLPMKDIK